ncbi:hypothetical protein HGRIS_001690 [Hohenbuehelia grisea]|uniref:F-box domain-containing protein n=1 Tax=Hohenbuehelia grisea TaxID=104357 RepID=A0ABR3JJF8_9AGAR
MVRTRRSLASEQALSSSKNSIPNGTVESSNKDDAFMDDLSDLSSLDSESDNDEDFASDPAEDPDSEGSSEEFLDTGYVLRPAKRAKLGVPSSSEKSPKKAPARRKKSLSLLPTMPLDILFEIFSQLEPRDLLSLSYTSKLLRSLLWSKKSISIWMQSLAGADTDCPSDMIEPTWAALLFGGSFCSNCGAKGVHKIDFGLRRRLCRSCRKSELVISSRFSQKYPHANESIMELIPYTNIGGYTPGWAPSERKYYWGPDIEDMQERLDELQEDIDSRQPGAKQAMEDFVTSRKALVAEIRSTIRAFEQFSEASAYNKAH